MAKIGSKQNSGSNGEWAKHVRWCIRQAAGRRRKQGDKIIKEVLKENASS